MAQFFKVNSEGVHVGEGSNSRDTSTNPTFESNVPAHFYIDTTLPQVVNYNPQWISTSSQLYNGANETEPISIKKIGCHVFVEGCLLMTADSDEYPLAVMVMPEGARPQFDHYCLAYTNSGDTYGCVKFGADGIVTIEVASYYAVYSTSGDNPKLALRSLSNTDFGISTDYWCAYDEKLETMQFPAYDVLFDGVRANGLKWMTNIGLKSPDGTNSLAVNGGSLIGGKTSELSPRAASGKYGYLCLPQIYIPETATQMHMTARAYTGVTYKHLAFGLADANETQYSWSSNAAINFSGNYNSICSPNITNNTTPALTTGNVTYDLDISNIPHNIPYRAFITFRNTGTSYDTFYINKVWFT